MQAADRPRRGRPRPGRRLPRLHRPAHRAQPQGQVRRPRALGRAGRVVGEQRPHGARRPSPRSSPTCASTSAAPSSSCRTSTPAPTPPTASTSASSPSSPGTASSSATCCAARPARSSPASSPASPSSTAPRSSADPARHGCRSETVIAISFEEKLVLIGGTAYAGENKKSVFTLLNYLLPEQGVMPMHCSANHAQGRSRRRRRLLRPLRHRQDHPLRRPGARPHRRRRARLVRRRHLQLRGRLLRQDHQPLARRPSPRSTPPPTASAPSSRTWSGTRSPARSTSPTTA